MLAVSGRGFRGRRADDRRGLRRACFGAVAPIFLELLRYFFVDLRMRQELTDA